MDSPWHENDTFWDALGPFFFDELKLAAAPQEIDHIIILLNLTPHTSVLDLCCGTGRHSLELARRSYTVTGVDRTAFYLEKARDQAEFEGLTVEFVQDDMRHFVRPEAFDAVIMMQTSFGYFESEEENQDVLKNVYNSLKHKGKLLMDLQGKEVLARTFCERKWRELNGALLREENKISNWEKVESRWVVFKNQEQHEFQFSFWIYSAEELSSLLKKCGFCSVSAYGSLEGSPYDHTAERLIIRAEK